MNGPLTKEALLDGLTAHLAASLQIDVDNVAEMEGAEAIARAAMDYFTTSVRGAPPGAGRTLMWAIYSALWEGQMPQEEIFDRHDTHMRQFLDIGVRRMEE